jgi:MFS family permease
MHLVYSSSLPLGLTKGRKARNIERRSWLDISENSNDPKTETTTTRSQQPSNGPALRVLYQRNFRLYWLGQLVSLVGTWMQQLAFSWVVLDLSRSAFALGTVNFVSALPPALLLLYGGTIADRFSKRKVLIVSQIAFMTGAFVLAWLVHSGYLRMWHILAMAVAMGVAQAFDLPASQALVPELVEPQQIAPAVQLNQAIFHGSRFIGPPLAGWLIARYGTYAGFLVNGISFVPVIATLFVIRSLRPGQSRPRKESTLTAMKVGFAYVQEHPFVLNLMGITALATTLVFPNMVVLMPYYVKDVLHQNAGAVGTVMGASGLGAFVGAMSLLVVRAEQRLRRIVLGMTGVTTAMLILGLTATVHLGQWGQVSTNLILVCVGAVVQGLSMSSSLGLVNSIIQQAVPDELRGRVTSLQTLVFIGIMPFSSLLMTKIVDIVSMPRELIGAALCYGVGAVILFRRLSGDKVKEALHA